MKNKPILKAVYAALFMAFVFVGTQFIRVPLPFGYFNMGDCFILLSAVILGGAYAVVASALGAALADILSGYVVYAPATVIVKSLMVIAMIAMLRLCKNKGKRAQNILSCVGAVVSECIMICGYFIYDTIVYGFAGAVASLPGNILQGCAAVVVFVIVFAVLKQTGLLKRIQVQ